MQGLSERCWIHLVYAWNTNRFLKDDFDNSNSWVEYIGHVKVSIENIQLSCYFCPSTPWSDDALITPVLLSKKKNNNNKPPYRFLRITDAANVMPFAHKNDAEIQDL